MRYVGTNAPLPPFPPLPELLRQIRGDRTQKAFADELGVRRTDYNAWETGRRGAKRGLSAQNAQLFAAKTGYPPEAFQRDSHREQDAFRVTLLELQERLKELEEAVSERFEPDDDDLRSRLEGVERLLARVVEASEPPAPAQERPPR